MKIEPSKFQQKVLLIPEQFDIFLGGGRGGSKSFALLLLLIRHCQQYKAAARVLYIRQTYKGMSDFENLTREFLTHLFVGSKYNAAEHVWRLPNGAYLELGQLESNADYSKYQGRSFTLLLVDEAGQYAQPELLDRLRSNLRGGKDTPIRMVVAANPGDVGHHWLASRYVFKAEPWKPFYEDKSKREFVYAPSTFLDNPHIDQDEYKRQLESSCPTDPELLRAWLVGDWAVARGAYFASCLEESRNAIAPWKMIPRHWETYLSHDYGSSAPSVTYIVAKSPGATHEEKYYPRDSIILVDELSTNVPGELSKGLNYTIPHLADAIKEFCKTRQVKPYGVADDACFSHHGHNAGSVADEFARCDVYFQPAKKGGRLWGWEVMRRMLNDAGKPDVPGLYISRSCEYFWQTAPYISRDPRNANDVDSRGNDHGIDSCRYALTHERHEIHEVQLYGL